MDKIFSIHDIQAMKPKRKISMVTCYDATSALIINKTLIDLILVGDSVAMTVYGYPSTIHATLEMMVGHVAAVARGAPNKFIVADLPFLTFRKGAEHTIDCAGALLRAGAHAVKVEGVWGHEDSILALVQAGIPVMGHIGLTPQSVHQLGGFKVQGKGIESAQDLANQSKKIYELGCFALVLECIPASLAESLTLESPIPTIGIGAGKNTDGQVLVWQDLLGLDLAFKPKFVRHFAELEKNISQALSTYHQAVLDATFPEFNEAYHG